MYYMNGIPEKQNSVIDQDGNEIDQNEIYLEKATANLRWFEGSRAEFEDKLEESARANDVPFQVLGFDRGVNMFVYLYDLVAYGIEIDHEGVSYCMLQTK